MKYAISIDWLSIHCWYYKNLKPMGEYLETLKSLPHDARPADDDEWEPVTGTGEIGAPYPWRYKLAEYGTRQFARLYSVLKPNEEGGWDEFAEVQASPHSNILNRCSVIVRFVNRTLYMPDFWELAERFLDDNHLHFRGITRIDICADFNQFKCMSPRQLIEDFAAKKLRHIGRGVGAMYFNHGIGADPIPGNAETLRDYGVRYTGLSFGTHSSDARVYLYDKSFELLTQGNKPWIKDVWKAIGLDIRCVWRLEISLKSKACKFKDKQSGKKIAIDFDNSKDKDEIATIFHTFEHKMFRFIRNKKHISNVSREDSLQLFDLHPLYSRGVIRNKTAAKKFERMFIKALWQLKDLYRGGEIGDLGLLSQDIATAVADATDLLPWLAEKQREWDKPHHK